MKNNILTIISFIFFITTTNAQSPAFQWVKQIGGTGEDKGVAMALDSRGNIYTTGDFYGTVDFDPDTGTYNMTAAGWDTFILKLDPNGNLIWAKQFYGGSNGRSIQIDTQGNIYTVGTYGTTDFDPGQGIYQLVSTGSSDIFISKLDSLGNFIFAKSVGGTKLDVGASIAIDSMANIYVTGSFQGTADFNPDPGLVKNLTTSSNTTSDIFVLKLNSNGDFTWVKQMGGSWNDEGRDISLDENNNVYTIGTFNKTADFDPSTSVVYNLNALADGAFISKLDTAGNFVWAKGVSSNNVTLVNDINVDINNNVLITGNFNGLTDFNPGVGTHNLSSHGFPADDDIFILKLDSSGSFVWVKQIEYSGGSSCDDVGYSIDTDSLGNIYTTGSFGAVLDFDPGSGVFNLYNNINQGCKKIFVLKLDSSGNFNWVKGMGGSGNHNHIGYSVKVDLLGNVYTTGSFNLTADFDPGIGIYNLTSIAGSDCFIHKIGACINYSSPINTSPSANLLLCNGESTTIIATGSGDLSWYSSPQGGSFLGYGNTYTTSNLTSDSTFYVYSTCQDTGSNTPITIDVIPLITSSQNLSICANDSVVVGTHVYHAAGTYYDIFAAANGCDSTVTTIIVNPIITSSQIVNICAGDSLIIGTSIYYSSGIYNSLFTASNGCDSIITTHLTVYPIINTNTYVSNAIISAYTTSGTTYQWINCSNNAAIAGANNQSYTATINGDYAVIITKNGCSDTSSCVAISNVGIDKIEKLKKLLVYPNPTKNVFNIEINSLKPNTYKLSLINIAGQIVYDEKITVNSIGFKKQIDIENLSQGIYLIQLANEEAIYSKRVIKE